VRVRLRCLVVAVVLAVAGCGPAAPAEVAPPPATGPLTAFTATTLDGARFDGASLAGRPAVLWFWAPWCPTCLGQAPGVREALRRYGDEVSIVGVAGLDRTEAMPEFVRLAKLESMPHIADEAGVVWRRFEVTAQSTFVFLDAGGQVTYRGRPDAAEIPDRVAALVG
jgi:thiol-disulfide isomerase/thioredoxin